MNKFREARLIAGMTQRELADKLGISMVSVSKWESGKGLPKAKRIKEVADALNTTPANLLKERAR